MRSMHRRDFLHRSATFTAALAGVGLSHRTGAASQARSANDQLRVAVVGVNGRGMDHVKGFAGKHGCVVTTICDCDEWVIGRAMTATEKAQGKAPKFEKDIRKVIEDRSIDIVSIATPNHWHALMAIWALQNGKDVYVEKPVSHNVLEGRRIVEAARKYHRICQTGTQCRTMSGTRQAMDFLHSGKLGKITVARALCYKSRPSIGKVQGEQPLPKTIDYDLWCGPAPRKPLMRTRLHYDWHWTWDYGNGDLGNQGIHQMDVARWGIGKNELPRSALSLGGRLGYVDDGETANTQLCSFDYGDCKLIFEVRGLPTPKLYGAGVGNVFYGTEGYMVCPGYDSAVARTYDGELIARWKAGGDHYGNFVQAVRSRRMEELNADILEGHLSSALCHLGNVSYLLGAPQAFTRKAQAVVDDRDAAEALARMEQHLMDNKLPLEETTYRLGRRLTLDAKSETVLNDKEANALLTREYRKGFEVPDKV